VHEPSKRPFKHVVIGGKISPKQHVPEHIACPPYAHTGKVFEHDIFGPFPVKEEHEIEGIRRSCQLARRILDYAGSLVAPGVTTDEIDAKVHKAIIDHGAYPSPLNYNGFPKSICTSVNEVVVHGIPDDRPLLEGDIIKIDITVYYEGYHGDTCETYMVGNVDAKAQRLTSVCKKCLHAGIAAVRPGAPIHAIGEAIHRMAAKHGYGVPPELTGHGIGTEFHTRPFIPFIKNDFPGIMEPGLVFTIEPVITEKKPDFTIWDDKWTAVTNDGGWSAQFEHTVLVTPEGVDVLTA